MGTAIFRKSVAAATAVVGYDLMVNDRMAKMGINRTIRKIALVGSAVLQDSLTELKIDGKLVATLSPTTIGVVEPKTDTDIKNVNFYVPANAQVEWVVTDAPATNPLIAYIEFNEYEKRAGGTTRRRISTSRTRRTGSRSSSGMYS